MAQLQTVAQTGSTNDDLAALAATGVEEGFWLRAERQTGGKGRQGRAWLSPAGNLYASTLVRLRPGDPPAPGLALVAAIALFEAIAPITPEARLKWPNDLMIGAAKCAGILLERQGDAVIVGFGVNLAAVPDGIDRPATSLAGRILPADLLKQLAARFADWLARWRGEGLAPVRSAWLAAAHPLGTSLRTHDGAGRFEGLDESGALRLRLEDGGLRVIHAGDVFLL